MRYTIPVIIVIFHILNVLGKRKRRNRKDMDEEMKTNTYYAFRLIELICIGVFVFGFLWEGTIRFNLTTPQFMMLYGGVGAILSEILCRFFKKKLNKGIKK